MKEIKMILCDIDGTLLDDQKKIPEGTIESISQLKDKGILFGIATGRSPIAVKQLLEGWKIEEYVDILMGFNGAQYLDFVLDRDDSSHLIDGAILKDVLELYKDFDVSFGIYDQYEYHATKGDELATNIAINNKIKLVVDDLSTYTNSQATKMLAMGQPDVIESIEAFYLEHQDPRYRGVKSTKNLFEFMNPNVSKSFGIAKIAENHGFTLENVCVFGDELNDFEMIRDCGVGVCMDNGNPAVKEIANYITDSNNDNGIGKFIDKYILDK